MGDLPRGAVTFLFTDIEGSTRLVKQLRDSYGDVLREHQRLLREAFVRHGGHELDTQGDAFFVAFASAREAILAAVEGQRAISGYPWPNGAPVKVRMGVHTGQASPVDGRYTGLAVHRAARICAAGHGGQVLVSQATQTLLEDEEEDLQVALEDLGSQRLKDLERPVHLYQVAAAGLPSAFPPVRGENEAAVPPAAGKPFGRHALLVGGAGLALLAAAGSAVVLLRGGEAGGVSTVHPNSVGVIDARSGRVVDEVAVGVGPGPITTGGGSVWVGNTQDRTLTRIDIESRDVTSNVQLDRQTPTDVAYGSGAVFVAHGLLGSLSRVDPQFGDVKTAPITARALSGAVATGGGSVWAVYGDSTLARVEPATLRVLGTGPAGANPVGIVYVNDGIWIVNNRGPSVSRFNRDTFEEGSIKDIPVGQDPAAIAAGAGAIWVANRGDDTVTRIDATSYAVSTIAGAGDRPTALAFADGAVWVADRGGTVARVDPSTLTVTKTIKIGNAPAGIAASNGLVWVSVQAP